MTTQRPEYQCVYGLGECPVLLTLGEQMKDYQQRTKVHPAEPNAAAVSQMIQPFMQVFSNVHAMLPNFCPNCPKRIVAVEKELAVIRSSSR